MVQKFTPPKKDGEVKIVAVQMHVYDGNIQANMEHAMDMAMRVANNESGVDLIMFHEACLESGTGLEAIDLKITADVVEFWKSVAKATGSNILAGRVARGEDGKVYNKATVFTPAGNIIADFTKVHLYRGERTTMEPGNELSIFTINGVRFGIMICADFGFMEFSRKYALAGVHALCVSSSWAEPDHDLWDICNRAHSSFNGIYCCSVDRVGWTQSGLKKIGRSICCDPEGTILVNLEDRVDTYYCQTLYRHVVEHRHTTLHWLQWVREDLYHSIDPEAYKDV